MASHEKKSTALEGDVEIPAGDIKEHSSVVAPNKAEDASNLPPDPRRWIGLVVMLAGSLMTGMDSFIVNVAVPSIQKELGANFAAIQFVVAGYSLMYAVLLITGGRLGDIYGRKRLFLVGVAGFVSASTLCGFAPNPVVLVGSRLLQGSAAALLFPQILAMIQVTFTGKERDRAFGWYGMTVGLSQAIGLAVGGLLLSANFFGLGWRPLFLINLPLGITVWLLAIFFVPNVKKPPTQQLDLGGVGIITLGLGSLIFPLVQGRQAGWPWWAFLLLGISVLILIGFFFYERSVADRGGSPLLNQSLFHNRTFIRGLLTAITLLISSGSFLFTVTFYLQAGLGLPALISGLTTVPFALGIFLASFASVPIKSKIGKYVLTCGTLTMMTGLLIFIGTVAFSGPKPNSLEFLPAMFVAGFGFGLVLSPLINILLSSIASAHAGAASGMLGTSTQTGLSLGVALIGIIFFGSLAGHATYAVTFIRSLSFILIVLLINACLIFSLPNERKRP